MFLNLLNGQIGLTVANIFVIDQTSILTVSQNNYINWSSTELINNITMLIKLILLILALYNCSSKLTIFFSL